MIVAASVGGTVGVRIRLAGVWEAVGEGRAGVALVGGACVAVGGTLVEEAVVVEYGATVDGSAVGDCVGWVRLVTRQARKITNKSRR